MTDRTWFSGELETVATYWRVQRRDGIALGFTSHDRDLRFAGVLHLSAPGMVPSAIKRSILVEPDSAEMQGALDHAAIRAGDLASGRFDGAAVSVGLVDWESGENLELFAGSIGAVGQDGARNDGGVEGVRLSGSGYPNGCPQPIVILGLDPRIGVALDRRRATRTDPRVKPEDDGEEGRGSSQRAQRGHGEHSGGSARRQGSA